MWQACIAIHSAPRFLFVALYRNLYHQRLTLTSNTKRIVNLNITLAVIENFALLGLSIVSSQEQFDIHKVCFGTFLFCAFMYMATSYYLLRFCGFSPQNSQEFTSLYLKRIIVSLNLVLIPLLMFFYHRHNEYCEPYVYSWFCVCEYLIVLSNMSFHGLAYKDFGELFITLPSTKTSGYEALKEIA